MTVICLIIICSVLPVYYVCNVIWQNIILLFISLVLIHNFLPVESYIILSSVAILYVLGYLLIKKPSIKLFIVLCLIIAYVLIVFREQVLVVKSVISFLFLNSVAFLYLCIKQKRLPPIVDGGLYIMYFPKVICGPYEKAEEFLGYLQRQRVFSFSAIIKGIALIVLGFLERYALAGNISTTRERLLNSTTASLADFIISGMLFGFELFFIISAFTSWAKGTSVILGIPISDNFRFPFIASSISDFWRRWHISVHIWLKEFIFQPLKKRYDSLAIGILITFIISGIWHKPTFMFLIWGAVAALLILAERKSNMAKYEKYFGIPLVLIITGLLWNFFQTDNISGFIPKGIYFQNHYIYSKLLIMCLIAFTLSIFCDIQIKLIEKKPSYFVLPLFIIDIGLLLVLWPNRIVINSVYGF